MTDVADLLHIVPESLSVDEAAQLLVEIRDFRQDLASLAHDIEAHLVEKAPKRFTVDGLGEVQIRHSDKRSHWDNEALTAKVVAYALDERILDESTGEFEAGFAAVARVLSECARPSWRLTPLRARGIDPDEYSSVEEGHLAVQLPPREDGK